MEQNKTMIVHSQRLAGYLMYMGFPLLRMVEDFDNTDNDLFIFNADDYIDKEIENYKINNGKTNQITETETKQECIIPKEDKKIFTGNETHYEKLYGSLGDFIGKTKLCHRINLQLSDSKREFELNIPYSIFDEINKRLGLFREINNEKVNGSHRALLFGYWCITKIQQYLRNNTKQLSLTEMKHVLGYNYMSKGISEIIKKNGISDKLGFTAFKGKDRIVAFDDSKRFFKIDTEDVLEILYVCNGCMGLYLFCYILHKWLVNNHKGKNTVKISDSMFKNDLKIDKNTTQKYINILVKLGYILKISGELKKDEYEDMVSNESEINKYKILKCLPNEFRKYK